MVKLISIFAVAALATGFAQSPGALRVTPNLESNIARPLRYRPDGADFVIENGAEFFNRPLYGGNTAFRVDGGDKPEFVLYLPGRGGNLRLGVRSAAGTKWLHDAATIVARYRPGELLYEIRDPLLGTDGVLRLAAIALHQTEGLIVRAEGEGITDGVELVWAYGGVNGQRGARDGDIGTERVPISEWFQLKPEFCRDNQLDLEINGDTSSRFTVRAKAATIVGVTPPAARMGLGDASRWNDLAALLLSAGASPMAPKSAGTVDEKSDATDARSPFTVTGSTPDPKASKIHVEGGGVSRVHVTSKLEGEPRVVVGLVPLANKQPLLLSVQRVAAGAAPGEDLATYREVGAPPAKNAVALASPFAAGDLPRLFDEAEKHFAALRARVSVDTPDPFLNAAVGALNVAADAVWDEPQQDIMHGAIAWRTRLLGWRGPYALDALGWHERAQKHFEYWAGRQNQNPIPEKLPPADEKSNLARNEAGLHSNGDMSNSHYDMNLGYIDALFRHLRWTGDLELAKKMWPTIERHLAWERRLFRREFTVGGEKLPLYEAYAAIWASDDLQYSGGGTAHASAYNYFHNEEAARLAPLVGADPAPYAREAELIARGMRELLWVKQGESGWFGESKDWLGLQRVHPAAAVWSFYHTMDSGLPTPQEAWQITGQIDAEIPHLPVRGSGVPNGLITLASSNWLPYTWSINNVVMGEALHTALGFWQAGRADEAWRIAKGSFTAAMFMGISPGNVGSMSYLDVYRRESQRDFADGSGVMSRAIVEGLFGVKPDALAGELRIEPGWPSTWEHASLQHPDVAVAFHRSGEIDSFAVEEKFAKPLALRLRVPVSRERAASVRVNGRASEWRALDGPAPRIEIVAPAAARFEIEIAWAGQARTSGEKWQRPSAAKSSGLSRGTALALGNLEPLELASHFNDRVTQIFKNEYRAPRSPFVSLAIPKQGIGAWAGHVNETADIDDSGLRALAAKGGGKFSLPSGVTFATPGEAGAKNVLFVSQWDNYPREASVELRGRASGVALLMAGSTNHMQSRFDNGEVIVSYADGTTARLALRNPETWWPIEQDYFLDEFQFRDDASLPARVDLKTGHVRVLDAATFKGKGGKIPGGAATVLELPLDRRRELRSLTVRALANDVVIGLMAATLAR